MKNKKNKLTIVIDEIVRTGKKLSFYKKINTSETFEFDIFQKAVKYIAEEEGGIRKQDFLNFSRGLEPVLKEIDIKVIAEDRDKLQHLLFNMARAVSITKAFENSGKQVFYILKEFTDLMKKTDFPEKITLEEFVLPYPSFFMHVEGFQIKTDVGNIFIEDLLISSKSNNENLVLEILFIEKTKVSPEIRKIVKSKESIAFSHLVIEIKRSSSFKDLFKKLSLEIRNLLQPENFDSFEKETFNLDEIAQVYEEISRVLINLILYLNYINEDVVDISNIPEKLKERKKYYEEKQDEKKLQKIEKEINRYTKLYLIGKKSKTYYSNQLDEYKKTGSKKRPHWRRGHIRYLEHPKFKKKWTYVSPALIGKKSKENNGENRIYEVK